MQTKMKEFGIDLLKREIPFYYYYHNYEHTLYVMEKVVEIAKQENCTEKEIELLHAAALWHDTGFIHVYANHEEESCAIARKYLPEYGYSEEDISVICGMIMATKIPQSPKTNLEQMLADADLEYLGSGIENAVPMAERLFKELQHINPGITKETWDRIQISFIHKHAYFTPYCKEHKTPEKLAYLKSLTAV